ncbi:MAG: hypothetical protein Q9211_003776 [Gyalolechia sp. 1 TL-2023]
MGDLSVEPLAVDDLFWLAVGCLVAPRRRVYSLENVQPLGYEEAESEGEEDTESGDWEPRHGHLANWARERESGNPMNTYVVPSPTMVPEEVYATRKARDIDAPRGCRFTENHERIESLSGLARSVEPSGHKVQVFSLEEVELSDDEMEMLQYSSQSTYVSSQSPWVRLGSTGGWFLNRSDAQILAHALLSLPPCPQGYLINGNTNSMLRMTLCAAADALPQLLVRMSKDIESLELEPTDRNELGARMERLLARIIGYGYNRHFASALFHLDVVLQSLQHPNKRANYSIGVLMITNPEFRELIAQAARQIPAAVNTSIIVDVANGCLVMPTVMGIMQRFSIDFDAVFRESEGQDTSITLSYTMVMILSLTAALRSTFFRTSPDSLPLFGVVMKMKEKVAYIG